MSGPSDRSRRSAPMLVLGYVVVFLAGVVILLLLAWLTWQQRQQIESLEVQVVALQGEQTALEAQVAAAQSTALALSARLGSLEANDPVQKLAELQAALETGTDAQDVAELRASLAEVQSQVDALQASLDSLTDGSEPAATTAEVLPSEVRLTVARQQQSHNLSCESSAASMVAQYHGLPLSEADVLSALPLNDNPYLGFRGNVDGPTGGIEDYGVYAGPILSILNDQGMRAWPVDGGLAGIKAALHRGNLVIAWITYNCLAATPVETIIDGQTVALVPNQHVVVVTGYNAEGVWANDPWDGQEDFYSTADFERAMSYFDGTSSSEVMAIEVAVP